MHTWTIQATRMNPMSKRMSCFNATEHQAKCHICGHADFLSSLHYTSKIDTINVDLQTTNDVDVCMIQAAKSHHRNTLKQLDKCFTHNMSNMFA